ncbi:MAG: TolC family protein [Bacteroidetes bacterium HGW-Bacteroidetes-8]|jgi:outer membrane protein TolC|nr:MAG: TolC family protein [Bacteroidetes bacterium HGW-Bacteroidetes-8]
MNKLLKMNKLLLFSIVTLLLFSTKKINAQEVIKLTFQEVIKLSEEQSPNALMAKHTYRASYWNYRTFVAQYRPSLTLTGTTPDYSTAYDKVWNSQFERWDYKATNIISNYSSLVLSQNIGFTGGSISLSSDLTLYNDIENNSHRFISSPINIGLTQPLFRYNALKWQKKIEPLRYQAAKKTFITSIESVHQQAVSFFFSLALAQINKQIADINYSNADTLWRISKGRYELGTIAEDELLQMQLSWLNAETSRKEAEINLRDREIRMRSFLGFNENVRLELTLPTEIPSLQVSIQEVFDLAMANNPEILTQQLKLLAAQSNVAQAKAESGFNANLIASFGLRDQDPNFRLAYSDPNQQQRIRIGFSFPILDWGLGKGKYKMAKSSLELAQVQSEQTIADFQQNLYLDVEKFNLQAAQVGIAAKSDTVAQKMFEVTKQRFLIGKISVLELNNADSKKDQNKRAYVQSLQNYWNFFYNLRSLTLYDFVNKRPLETDYDNLIK